MTLGTDYLLIILLWCGDPHPYNPFTWSTVRECRREKIECVSKLKNFDTDMVVSKCLLGGK